MSHAKDLFAKMHSFLETSSKSFRLPKGANGWGFTEPGKKKIPSGNYVVVEPDDRDKTRVIISKKGSYEMFAIKRSDIPT